MKIEANLGYKPAGKGVNLPEYLVRITHREAIAMGAKTFQIGEELTLSNSIEALDAHIRSLSIIRKAMEDVMAWQPKSKEVA